MALTVIIGFMFVVMATLAWSTTRSSGAKAASATALDVADTDGAARPRGCKSARKAVSYYRAKTWSWQQQREAAELADRTPLVRGKSCHWARYASEVWHARAQTAHARFTKWLAWKEYHYDWEKWLPSNWVALARCETGINFEHSNSSFTSAFGISWSVYNGDARHMGAPPWHVRHTPRDQYLAALGHLDLYGDGWSCPGP